MTHDWFFPCPGCGDALPHLDSSDAGVLITCSCGALSTRGRVEGQDWCLELVDEDGVGSIASATVTAHGSVTGVICYPEAGIEFPPNRYAAVGMLIMMVKARAVRLTLES